MTWVLIFYPVWQSVISLEFLDHLHWMLLLVWLGLNLPFCYLWSVFPICYLFPLSFVFIWANWAQFMVTFCLLYCLVSCTSFFVVFFNGSVWVYGLHEPCEWLQGILYNGTCDTTTLLQHIFISPSWPCIVCVCVCMHINTYMFIYITQIYFA